jgi:hypothetical protein
MHNTQPLPPSYTQPATQTAPESLTLAAHSNQPDRAVTRIGVDLNDIGRSIKLLEGAAQQNGVTLNDPSVQVINEDFGQGKMWLATLSFSFKPDRADGTFSPEYLKKVNTANTTFGDWLNVERIKQYGPEE